MMASANSMPLAKILAEKAPPSNQIRAAAESFSDISALSRKLSATAKTFLPQSRQTVSAPNTPPGFYREGKQAGPFRGTYLAKAPQNRQAVHRQAASPPQWIHLPPQSEQTAPVYAMYGSPLTVAAQMHSPMMQAAMYSTPFSPLMMVPQIYPSSPQAVPMQAAPPKFWVPPPPQRKAAAPAAAVQLPPKRKEADPVKKATTTAGTKLPPESKQFTLLKREVPATVASHTTDTQPSAEPSAESKQTEQTQEAATAAYDEAPLGDKQSPSFLQATLATTTELLPESKQQATDPDIAQATAVADNQHAPESEQAAADKETVSTISTQNPPESKQAVPIEDTNPPSAPQIRRPINLTAPDQEAASTTLTQHRYPKKLFPVKQAHFTMAATLRPLSMVAAEEAAPATPAEIPPVSAEEDSQPSEETKPYKPFKPSIMQKQLPGEQQPNVRGAESAGLLAAEKLKPNRVDAPKWREAEGELFSSKALYAV